MVQLAQPAQGQRENRQRLAQVDHLHHHRNAVTGNQEAVGRAEQRPVGVFRRLFRPLEEFRLGGQLTAQHLDDLGGGAAAGGDVGRSAQLVHDPVCRRHQLSRNLSVHHERVGFATHQDGDEWLRQGFQAAAPLPGLRSHVCGVYSHQRQADGQVVGHRRQLVFSAGNDQGKVQHVTAGFADQHDPGAIAGLLAYPQRHHGGATADCEDQVGPRRLDRIRLLRIDVVQRGLVSRLAQDPLGAHVHVFALTLPAEGIDDRIDLAVVALLVAD